MKGTFNAFGQTLKSYENATTPVWLGTVSPVPVGGTLASGYAVAGALYKAGFPIKIDGKTITPVLLYKVKSVTTASSAVTSATLTPLGHNVAPTTSMKLIKVTGSTYPTGQGTAITAVAKSGDDYVASTTVSVAADDIVAVAGAVPNAYLYNDIYMDGIESEAGASGAAVKFHSEGILVDRTPAEPIKAYMATLVPGVLQVNG